MKSKILVALLIAATTSVAAPAFASGYGPAPSYRPSVARLRRSEARVRKPLRPSATMRSAPSTIRTVVSLCRLRNLASVNLSSLLAVCTQATDLKAVS
jgi:hypothetical protein